MIITLKPKSKGELLLLFGDGICEEKARAGKDVSWEVMRVSSREMMVAGTGELDEMDGCGLDGK